MSDIGAIMRRIRAARPADSKYADLYGPGRVRVRGDTAWAFASDGHLILFARPHLLGQAGQDLPLVENRENHDKVAALLDTRADAAFEHDLARLKEWAGPAVWTEPCPACKGTSAKSDYVICVFCDNAGKVGPEPRPGLLHGAAVDRRYLAQLLSAFGSGICRLELTRNPLKACENHPMFAIAAEGLRGVIMGLDLEKEDGDACKKDPFPQESQT